jgi:hypothetical protein
MGLPALYAQPDDPANWRAWSFNHAANHVDMLAAAQAKAPTAVLEQFILDPMNPDDLGMWLYQHATMHDQLNTALGTSGFDLLGLDWQDPQQFATWLRLNGDEHTRLSGLLGVG